MSGCDVGDQFGVIRLPPTHKYCMVCGTVASVHAACLGLQQCTVPSSTQSQPLIPILAQMTVHRHRIMHRDIKPENILLGSDDKVILTDFGVSHAVDLGSEGTSDGTPAFTSPEACSGVLGAAVGALEVEAGRYFSVSGTPFAGLS